MIHKIKLITFFFVIFGFLSNILAQKLKIYEDYIDPNKLYKQGATIQLNENNDIRIYSSSNHQTENSVAINPVNPNNVIISTNGRLVFDNNGHFVTAHQPYFYTLDGGISWNGSESNPNGIYSFGDPVVFFDLSGNAYYVTLGNPGGIYVLKSTDGGATWGSIVNADSLNGYDDDKEHATADVSGTYPNNIYVAWTDFDTTKFDVIFTRSTNSGNSFGKRIILYSGKYSDTTKIWGQGTNIAIGPNGEVYVAFAFYNGSLPESSIRFTKSTNGGASFSPANVAFSISGIRTSYFGISEFNNTRVNSFPSMEVDRSNGSRRGWIYIVYADKNSGDSDIYLRRSTDGGATWSSAIRVNSDQVGNGKQQWFPSVDVDEMTGIIYVSYYNMDSTGFLTARYVAISYDGGNTFNCSRISDVRFTPTELGAGYRDGYMGDYYETAVYNSKLFATWSDNREGNFQAYISLGVTAHQYLSDNSTEVGTIGHWETSQFVDYPTPAHFEFSPGDNHVLRGTQSIVSNEKYNRWNYDNIVKNFRSFDILTNTHELISYLKPAYSGVSIRNSLRNCSSYNDSIYFKDPWLIDYADPNYGNNKRNRGMDNDGPDKLEFQKRKSPFYPDFNTVYEGVKYQGVFLNQGYADPSKPYYSVKADAQQTFSAHGQDITGYFLKWDGTDVNFKSHNSQETPVVFKASNAEARAVYKGHLASENARPTGYNNGRRIAKNNTSLYMVYEDNSEIWFTSSSDNGQHWSQDMRLSPARYTDTGGNQHTFAHPSIAYSYSQLYVTWEEIVKNVSNQKRHQIAFAYKGVNDTNWQTEIIPNSASAWASNSYMEFPTIAAMRIQKVAVAWQDKTTRKIKVAQAYYEDEYAGYHWSSVSTFPEQGRPVIALAGGNTYPIKIVWADETLQFKQGKRTGDNLSWSSTVDLGEDLPEWYTENNNPSLDVESNGTGYIAWEAFDDAMLDDDILFQKYNLNGSGAPIGGLTIVAEDGAENPVVSYNSSNDEVTVLYQYNGQIHRKQKSGSSWNYTNLGSGKYPSLSAKASAGAVWSMYNSAPYLLKTEQLQGYLGKTSAVDVIAQKRFYFPEKEHISVAQMTELTLQGSSLQLNDSLASPPLWLDASNAINCQMKYLTKKGPQDALMQFWYEGAGIRSMMDAMTLDWKDSVAYKQFTFEPSKGGLATVSLGFSGAAPVAVNVIPEGGVLAKALSAGQTEPSSEPITDYELCANYPNPFNPATNIKIRLPKDGRVQLSVYTIAGEKVCDLIKGYRSAGEYTVLFDGSDLASGVYFYRLQAGNVIQTRGMLLVK